MNLVYVLDWPKSPKTGVPNKIHNQIKVWRKHDCEVKIVVIAPKIYKSDWLGLADQVFSYRSNFGRILSRFLCSVYIIFLKRPQIIYRRYGIYTFSEIMSIVLKPTIIELNTNISEYYRMNSRLAYLIFRIQNVIVGFYSAGACAVTPEIANIQNYELKSKCEVFTNSINLDYFLKKVPLKNKSQLSFVFVASDNFPWNGLKRFESIALQFPNHIFHIVGIDFDSYANIHSHKPIFGQELTSFLHKMDFGISTLDIQKVGLVEAAPLKSRLYLSQGLPVIGSYIDPALQTQSNLYFQIKFENPSNQIANLEEISNFIDYWRDKEISKSDLIQIDSDFVEKKRVEFIRKRFKENQKPVGT